MTQEQRAYVAWAVVCIVWGTTYLGIRIALETMPPFLMAAARWLIGGTLLAVVLKLRGERLPPPSEYFSLAIQGVLLLGIGNGAVVWAEQTVPSGLTAVLVAAAPFWMVAIERLAGGVALSAAKLAGLLIGFAGIVLLVWPELTVTGGRPFAAGVAATQFASVGWALGSAYSKRRAAHENVLAAASLQMVLAGVVLLATGLAAGEAVRAMVTARTGSAVLYLAVIGSVLGFSSYAYALNHLPVATVSLYAYVNPVIAVVLGSLLLDEHFSARVVVAAGIVFAGVALVRRG